jgi:conjugative transfer pilus assembly protein TraH
MMHFDAITRTAVLLVAIFLPAAAFADLQQEMDAMFGTMTNVTAPTAHLGQRRGVITSGSVVARNRVMSANMVSFVPPSFSAGCGGIDLFSGSFSFINMNQFVDLMRAVAANAAGYAFQLAINAMCPDCGNIMSDLQKKVQQLNQMFSNSCQLAQGLVNDAASVLPGKVQNDMKMSTISFSKGVTDVFGALTNASSQGDPVQQVKTNAATDMEKVIQGNLVWRALNQNSAGSWFKFGGNEFLQAAMSVTGSVIVKPPEAAPDGKGESNPVITLPNLLRIKDLLNGSGSSDYQTVNIYECDTTDVDGCLNPISKSVTLVGLKKRVRDILVGTGGGDGLIYKFATNTGPLTADEMAFMELVPGAISAMIRNLAREDYGMARLFADEGSPVIALEMAQLMIQGMLDAVRQASSLQDHAYATKLADTLDKARLDLQSESAELSGRYGNPQTLMQFYTNFMTGSKARDYGSFTQTPGSQVAYPVP